MEYIKLGLLFTAFGCLFEVFFTSVYDSIEQFLKGGRKSVDVRFFGYWSILYALIYGILLPIFWMQIAVPYLYDLPVVWRVLAYGAAFQVGEYLSMFAMHLVFGQSPSESHYKGKFDSIQNFTRLTYFPAFVVAGFLFETIYNWFIG